MNAKPLTRDRCASKLTLDGHVCPVVDSLPHMMIERGLDDSVQIPYWRKNA
jgi:hypothetical protein